MIELCLKIQTNKNKLIINRCRKLDSSTKKIHLSLIKNEKFKFITYHTTTKTYYSDIKLDIYENNKLLLNMSGYLNPIIVNDCNVTESKFYILDNYENLKKILELFNKIEIQNYLKLCKYSGFNSRIVLESIGFL